MSIEIPARVAARAASRFVTDGECWVSTYSVGSHGYAQIGWRDNDANRVTTAHRAAWTHYRGAIPADMTVDHVCKTRRCVRPSHLRLMTNFENGRRTSGRDWPLGQCANGHDNSELYQEPSGRTRCRSCTHAKDARTRERKRAART